MNDIEKMVEEIKEKYAYQISEMKARMKREIDNATKENEFWKEFSESSGVEHNAYGDFFYGNPNRDLTYMNLMHLSSLDNEGSFVVKARVTSKSQALEIANAVDVVMKRYENADS